MIRSFFAGSFLMFLLPLNAVSQADNIPSITVSDTSGSEASHYSLYSGAGYGTNMIYLGSTISQDQPFGYGSLTFGFRNSFYATVSAVHLSNLKPFAAFYTGSLNYTHTFNSWFDIATGAYRYQVTPSLTDSLFSSFWYGDLTFGVDWRIIYTRITAGSLFAGKNTTYLQVRNSRNFQTREYTRKKIYFTFDPYINLIFGPLAKVTTTTDTITTPSYNFHKKGKGQGAGQNPGSSGQIITYTDYSTRFGTMEIDFGLPVTLNYCRLTIEAEPCYVFPVYNDLYFPGIKGFVFTLTCYIRIF